MRALARRVARIEAANVAGTVRPIPTTIFVRAGENRAEAVARFNAAYPNRKPGHNVLVVPAKPRTDAEREVWANSFRDRQLALVSAARRERIVLADQSPSRAPPKVWPNSPVIRPPNGPHITWKPQC